LYTSHGVCPEGRCVSQGTRATYCRALHVHRVSSPYGLTKAASCSTPVLSAHGLPCQRNSSLPRSNTPLSRARARTGGAEKRGRTALMACVNLRGSPARFERSRVRLADSAHADAGTPTHLIGSTKTRAHLAHASASCTLRTRLSGRQKEPHLVRRC